MDFVSGIVVYLLLWWWIFLMSLPFGVRTADSPEAGHAASAPTQPYLWRKIAASTVIAGILCAVVNLVISSGLITLGLPSG